MAAAPAKTTKPKKTTPPAHPPYIQMIKEAIVALKERNGSSVVAIAKFVEDKHKSHLPPNFRKMLSVQLRRFSKSGKLVKVKNSYKVAPTEKKAPSTSAAAPKAKAPRRPTKKAGEAAKTKKAAPAKAKVVKKKAAATGAATKKVAATAPKKVAGAAAKKKPAKLVAGKKRTVKSIKSPKKAPAAKKAKV